MRLPSLGPACPSPTSIGPSPARLEENELGGSDRLPLDREQPRGSLVGYLLSRRLRLACEGVPLPIRMQLAQRHVVFLEEADQVLPGNPPVLRAGNAVPAQSAGVEPFANRPLGYLDDPGHLPCGEDCPAVELTVVPPGVENAGAGQGSQ